MTTEQKTRIAANLFRLSRIAGYHFDTTMRAILEVESYLFDPRNGK